MRAGSAPVTANSHVATAAPSYHSAWANSWTQPKATWRRNSTPHRRLVRGVHALEQALAEVRGLGAALCVELKTARRRSPIERADDLVDRLHRRRRAGQDRVKLRQVGGAAGIPHQAELFSDRAIAELRISCPTNCSATRAAIVSKSGVSGIRRTHFVVPAPNLGDPAERVVDLLPNALQHAEPLLTWLGAIVAVISHRGRDERTFRGCRRRRRGLCGECGTVIRHEWPM